MSRIVTVTDQELGIQASMVIEPVPDGTGSQITKLQLLALDGRGIRSTDLLILQELGLRLPTPDTIGTPPNALPPAEAGPTTPTQDPVPAKRSRRKPRAPKIGIRTGPDGRNFYDMPTLNELAATFAELNGSHVLIAAHYGVPRHIVTGWIRRFREGGHEASLPRTRTQSNHTGQSTIEVDSVE